MDKQDLEAIEKIIKEAANDASQNISMSKMEKIAEKTAEKAVMRFAKLWGVDVEDHIRMQKNMAFLDKLRIRNEQVFQKLYFMAFKAIFVFGVFMAGTHHDQIIPLLKVIL